MRMRVAVLSLLVLALTGFAAADEWAKEYNVGANPKLTVDTNDANVRVVPGAGNKISARVTTQGYKLSPSDVRVTEYQNGDAVDLKVHIPSRGIITFGGSWSVHVEVSVPAKTQLDLRSGDGRIEVTGIHAPARLNSGDGRIEVRDFDGPLTAHTSDGRMNIEGRFDDLQLDTGDGSIEAEVRPGSKMTGRWLIHTGDGSVQLRIPKEFAADLDAHTGDGHITLDLPITMNGTKSENSIRGKLNGGGQTLELRTGDGSIHIGRSGMI